MKSCHPQQTPDDDCMLFGLIIAQPDPVAVKKKG
jgi:hypothetical protein